MGQYRFVGKNHVHEGRELQAGEVVELSDTAAHAFRDKFMAVEGDDDEPQKTKAQEVQEAPKTSPNQQQKPSTVNPSTTSGSTQPDDKKAGAAAVPSGAKAK